MSTIHVYATRGIASLEEPHTTLNLPDSIASMFPPSPAGDLKMDPGAVCPVCKTVCTSTCGECGRVSYCWSACYDAAAGLCSLAELDQRTAHNVDPCSYLDGWLVPDVQRSCCENSYGDPTPRLAHSLPTPNVPDGSRYGPSRQKELVIVERVGLIETSVVGTDEGLHGASQHIRPQISPHASWKPERVNALVFRSTKPFPSMVQLSYSWVDDHDGCSPRTKPNLTGRIRESNADHIICRVNGRWPEAFDIWYDRDAMKGRRRRNQSIQQFCKRGNWSKWFGAVVVLKFDGGSVANYRDMEFGDLLTVRGILGA
ncbi:hypothetical protein C8T65DRAFT_699942 [Cerioporus squamosus]|nr:hypothetical protein C8T65DRAFT_699942 [Cerioporus squamosus]